MVNIPFDLILEHLDLADGFCLWIALACPPVAKDVTSQVCTRMGLRFLPSFTLHTLGVRMNSTQRCCRCGRPCRLSLRGVHKVQSYLCTPCSRFHLASRRQILKACSRPASARKVWGRLTLARLSVTGAHLYWVHQVKRVLEFVQEL